MRDLDLDRSKTRAAGLAAATRGRKTSFKSARELRGSALRLAGDAEVGDGIEEWAERKGERDED
jgi:hypothetical protein